MSNTTLKTTRRDGTGKGVARKMREQGQTPAVLYGGKESTLHLALDTHDADYLFRSISVDNTIVELEVEGEKEPVQALVREIQTHPWKANLVHVDFLRIQKGVAVDVDVPVNLVGTPVGVRLGGGTIEQIIHDLPLRCIPSKIPETIEVDISELDVGDVLHIADITFDEGVEVTVAQERTICSVSAPRAEVVAEVDEDGEGLGVDGDASAEASEGGAASDSSEN